MVIQPRKRWTKSGLQALRATQAFLPPLPRASVAVAIALFGTTSAAALATTVGVLTEVPVMLLLVKIANRTQGWFSEAKEKA